MSGVELRGTLAASVTPLTEDGSRLDEEAFPSLVRFLSQSGIEGLLAMGTTGEGILLDMEERRRAAELFVSLALPSLRVIVHAGAQTTRDTARLAEHAAAIGADGVAVIGPPYFAFDDRSLLNHFTEAGRACAPLPFFVYELSARSGYAVPVPVLEELRTRLPNFIGLKVSDTPWERFEPYLLDGLSIFVGPESLISRGMARGAVGAVSALAAALPELTSAAVRTRLPEASARCNQVRNELQRLPFHAALKRVLQRRGVRITTGVRAPLRLPTAVEAKELDALIDRIFSDIRPD